MANINVPEVFGSYTFNDATMKKYLPQDVYEKLHATITLGTPLDISISDDVAAAMKEWAISLGATHYTHWFQPLNNHTAEKHDSFIYGTEDGQVIMKFSGKELLRAEADASSFPSGGLRDTSAAKGYTAWDCTSPAFVKDTPAGTKVLCVPTTFTSYTGESLDNKTPLLRSMGAVDFAAKRVLKFFGKEPKRVITSVGPEQEYFIVDKAKFDKREDLQLCSRTLFGTSAPKGQEMDDNYFASINDKVLVFMNDLNDELWKYGILAKTQHNEVAPGQYELAVIYSDTNTANDNNQLIMELLQKVAVRHDLAVLLHEKPFKGINGSGKHNNWSLSTSDGENLVDPTKHPEDNLQFQLFLAAVVAAVDNNAAILRASAASVGNDHRLGAQEAPPAIISVYLGEQLESLVKQIVEEGFAKLSFERKAYDSGVPTMPKFWMDPTDRNRTSPFAFTGNKFEFRMVGSSQVCAQPITVLNTIVADELSKAADYIEGEEDTLQAIKTYIRKTLTEHQKCVFSGDGYSEAWVEEAARRGLPNVKNMVDTIQYYSSEDVIALFDRMHVMSRNELEARTEISYELYAKAINIEALVMIDMANKEIIPAVLKYEGTLAKEAVDIAANGIEPTVQREIISEIAVKIAAMKEAVNELSRRVEEAKNHKSTNEEWARYYYENVFLFFDEIRRPSDEIETLVAKNAWPIPTYEELLFEL